LGQLGTLTSSSRFKKDLVDMSTSSEAIFSLRPVTFRYKPDVASDTIPQFGLVAEEVEMETRLIEFGRDAVVRRAQRGFGKPETFNFLGFTHIYGKSRRGKFLLKRRSRRDRMRAKLREIKEGMRQRMHQPIPEQGQWLAQVIRGYFAITRCRLTSQHCVPSITTSRSYGSAR
jgi:hypothetical protein